MFCAVFTPVVKAKKRVIFDLFQHMKDAGIKQLTIGKRLLFFLKILLTLYI